ncbi:hypothetical protein SAMN05216228_1013107 [Rhizobium tibeticum]|uniref:Uncharacterized protein n=1 Tax=Rhizobium tibeticum TaxID=501024 RepID=A0A1H8MWR4_9HYPH|nr:hypothetical protein RTCCBAU85039_4425 [Rhizobium tibeticum]SEO21835.1 hypothetical protein SAMN05216228_1013107 [Rhizobium tibeticum]
MLPGQPDQTLAPLQEPGLAHRENAVRVTERPYRIGLDDIAQGVGIPMAEPNSDCIR